MDKVNGWTREMVQELAAKLARYTFDMALDNAHDAKGAEPEDWDPNVEYGAPAGKLEWLHWLSMATEQLLECPETLEEME